MTPPPGSIYEQRREERRGSGGVNAFSLLLRHPALADAFFVYNRHLLYENELDERSLELVVLRVACRFRADYEWAQHVLTARACGVTDDEIAAVAVGPEADVWVDRERDRTLLVATDGLLADGDVDDATWAVLDEHLDEREVLDLVFSVGCYATLAMAFNLARLPLDADLDDVPVPWRE